VDNDQCGYITKMKKKKKPDGDMQWLFYIKKMLEFFLCLGGALGRKFFFFFFPTIL
jgi:hypothetical protein